MIRRRRPLPVGQDRTPGPVLFYTPSAGIRPHFLAQLMVASVLAESGRGVHITRCGAIFERCPVMDMHHVPLGADEAMRRRVCRDCDSIFMELNKKFRLPVLNLPDFLTPALQNTFATALAQAPQSLLDFSHEDVPFGRLTTCDLTHVVKRYDYSQPDLPLRAGWLEYIRSALLSYLVCDAILTAAPVERTLHFSDYILHYACRLAARKHGLDARTVTFAGHNGIDFRRYNVLRHSSMGMVRRMHELWPQWRDLPIAAEDMRRAYDELLFRQQAGSVMVYSPPKAGLGQDLLKRFKLDPERTTLAAFTSSNDELSVNRMFEEAIGAALPGAGFAFPSQIEWLKALTAHVEARPELQLLVRIHPREGANRRDNASSEHLRQLREAFDRPFARCRFVWPGDAVSSYDVGEVADCVLVAWSTLGLEFARLGAPVLAVSGGITYPTDDFVAFAPDPPGYFKALNHLLEAPPSLDAARRACRYYVASRLCPGFDLGDVIPAPDCDDLPGYARPREAKSLVEALVEDTDPLTIHFERLLAGEQVRTGRNERKTLLRQIGRYIHFLCTGQDPGETVCVLASRAAPTAMRNATLQRRGLGLIQVKGRRARYVFAGVQAERLSPLAARLGRLLLENGRIMP